MNSPLAYHLVYRPSSNGFPEQILSIISSDNTALVACRLALHPGSEAMQLDAQCPEELTDELRELGFLH